MVANLLMKGWFVDKHILLPKSIGKVCVASDKRAVERGIVASERFETAGGVNRAVVNDAARRSCGDQLIAERGRSISGRRAVVLRWSLITPDDTLSLGNQVTCSVLPL